MSLSPEELRFIAEYTASIIGKINQVLGNRITTTFTNSNDVIPSSKLVKDEFATVRSEIPTNTSDLTNDGADGTHAFIVEGDSRLTDTRNPKPHNQASSTITDTNTYSNIGNTLQDQASINAAVNEKIGALMNLNIIEQVSTRPTASADTLNKIYAVPETTGETEDLFEIFITVYENNAYKWEKIDTARIDISGKVDKVQGKQLSTEDYTTAEKTKLAYIQAEANKTIVDSAFINNSTNPVQSNVIQTSLNSKANTSDLATVATSGNYNDLSNKPNVVEKSATSGLIKNDGTIDTNQYMTEDNIPESFNYGYLDSNLVLHLIYVDGEVTATNSIIQSGDTNTITAVITDKDNNPLEGMPVEFLVNGVKQGQTVNSNANGIATYNYTGTGAGEVDIQVRVGSFLSETYSITDCVVFDDMSSNIYESKYKRDNGASLSYSTEWCKSSPQSLKWEYDSSMASDARYFGFLFISNPDASSFDVDLIKDSTIRFEVNTNFSMHTTSPEGIFIRVYVKTTTITSWSKLNNTDGNSQVRIYEGENTYITDYEIPSNATQVWIRFDEQWGTASKTLYVDDWKLYPI